MIVFAVLADGEAIRSVSAAPTIPAEPRQTHPRSPAKLIIYDKIYDLTTLENPVRGEILQQLKTDSAKAAKTYGAAISAGRNVYYKNCFYCHGPFLDGKGVFSRGFTPAVADFTDPKSIASLSEAYLFWRITTGGPGLGKVATPWNSAMPAAGEFLSELGVWNVIMFLYDRIEKVPPLRDPNSATAMSAMQGKITATRKTFSGNQLYQFHCSACHGDEGFGDGPAASVLYPAPRDFSVGLFKYKTSPSKQQRPTDDDLFRTIKKGLNGTAMPAYGTILNDDQIRSLIPIIKKFDTIGTWAPEDAPDEDFDDKDRYTGKPLSFRKKFSVENQIPFSRDSVAAGERHFKKNCTPCHGDQGRGSPSPEKKLKDDWGKRIWPRDLTKPWTWRVTNVAGDRKQTIRNIYTRLSLGIVGTPMPSHTKGVSEQDRWYIANYIYTLRDTSAPPNGSTLIQGIRVKGALPDRGDDNAWQAAPVTTLLLHPNVFKGERLFTPLNDAISVRVLYNAEKIAFLLELDDRTNSRPGDPDAEKMKDKKLKLHPDAIAIQFPKRGTYTTKPTVQKPLFSHGDKHHPTTIWYWRTESVEPKRPAATVVFDGAGTDAKLHLRAGDSSLTASGKWTDGIWRVIMKRRRDGGASGDVDFVENHYIPISFANWDGSNGETGSKHTLTPWSWVLLAARETSVGSSGNGQQ